MSERNGADSFSEESDGGREVTDGRQETTDNRRETVDDEYTIDDVAFLGRTIEEYERMFDLDSTALAGERVLDCPGGAGVFTAAVNEQGGDAVATDLCYGTPPEQLREKCVASVEDAIAGFDGVQDQFVWSFYDDVADVRDHWTRAYERFIEDYEQRHDTERYVPAELPALPFPDDHFSLVLSAHLLFLYADDLSYEFHEQSLLELARVAAEEVRVFPLVSFDGEQYPRLDELRTTLVDAGYESERRPVPFEFLRRDPEMLVIRV
jgi:ubiquinone/menaquinone biosynthesis C-methylase UbiE